MTRGARLSRLVSAAVGAVALVAGAVPAAGAFAGWIPVASPNPGAYGSLFRGITARTPTDAWAVGASATATSNQTLAAHWSGTSWSAVPTPNPVGGCQDGNIQWAGNSLNAVAAVAAADVWAVGHSCYSMETLVEHWNGTTWSIVASPNPGRGGGDGVVNSLNDVAASSAADVWAVGFYEGSNGADKTLVEHWNGTKWSVVSSPSPSATTNVLTAVAAVGPADVWAVGYKNGGATQPLIEHWDGTSWSTVRSPRRSSGSILSDVAAGSATDVWAVGSQPGASGAQLTLVEHWNGQRWKVVPSPNLSTEYGSANVLRGVAAVSPTDVWAVGMFQNENTDYHQHRTLTLHWDGGGWNVVSSPTPGKSGELGAVAALPAGQLWAAGVYSNYEINIYDGTYTDPRTLVLSG